MEELELKQIEQKESVKLVRNAKGSYQWEIKLHIEDDAKALKRLEDLDLKLREIYI